MEKDKLNLVSDDLNSLEKGEIFLNMKEIMGLSVETISQATNTKVATIYNGIKLAHLPPHLKEYIKTDQITSSSVLKLIYKLGKKSPTFHKDLEKLIKAEVEIINKRKQSGEYRKRVTLYDKFDQLKELSFNPKKENHKIIQEMIDFIEKHENMEGILDI